jgi:hypothetical protein
VCVCVCARAQVYGSSQPYVCDHARCHGACKAKVCVCECVCVCVCALAIMV